MALMASDVKNAIEPDLPGVRARANDAPGGLPLFIEPASQELDSLDGALTWFADNKEKLDALVTQVGAIVLRGFPIDSTAAFGGLVDGYGTGEHGYVAGATPRAQVGGRVFEATRVPAAQFIGLHQEMSYLPNFPAGLAFFCLQPSATGGETIIGDMRRLTDVIPRPIYEAVKARGVQYRRNFRSPDWSTGNAAQDVEHKPWTDAFETTDRSAAEAKCVAMGLDYEWVDGSMTVLYNASGFLAHPITGEEVWFNQIATMSNAAEYTEAERLARMDRCYSDHPRPLDTRYGDGGVIARSDISALIRAFREVTVAFPWQHGDVMILDNIFTAHGRNPYTGTRDVQVSLLY